jgi:hypothetical protein
VNAILNAVNQYMADNKGALPTGITTTDQTIAATTFNTLCTALVPTYIAALPVDPLTPGGSAPIDAAGCTGTTWTTGYMIVQSGGSNRLTVSAPAAELQATINVSR